MFKFIIYEKKGYFAHITFNRPEVMNAINPPAQQELWDALFDFRKDPDLRVAILTGAGEKAFSAGDDLKYPRTKTKGSWEESSFMSPQRPGSTGHLPTGIWKPLIAAVNGYCLGGGLEMALNCDIIIAADHATFGLPEVTIGGLPPSGVFNLPRDIPLKVAMHMILTGERISAQEAYRLGLVNKVVPLSELIEAAIEEGELICRNPQPSVQAIKECVMRGLELPVNYPARASDILFKPATMDSLRESGEEGRRAFAEKRPPNYDVKKNDQ